MATYELFLWQPEVDLTAAQWQKQFDKMDDDEVEIKEIVEYQIYYQHHEDLKPAAKLLAFFQILYDIVSQEQYLPYFNGLVDAVKADLEHFKQYQKPVFRTEADYLAHRRDKAFGRAIYQAIEQSGICAFCNNCEDGWLILNDPHIRVSVFNRIFRKYPELETPVISTRKITSLDDTPQSAKDLKQLALLFMQQHPIGKHFVIDEISYDIEKYDEEGQAYESIIFKYIDKEITYEIWLGILHHLTKPNPFRLDAHGFRWSLAPYYFSEQQLAIFEKERKINFNGINVKYEDLFIRFNTRDLNYFRGYDSRKSITNFEMKADELSLVNANYG